jgi:hypothetical protein
MAIGTPLSSTTRAPPEEGSTPGANTAVSPGICSALADGAPCAPRIGVGEGTFECEARVGPSWRVIAGLRNPYEEGGADEDELSFDEASLAVEDGPAPLDVAEYEEWEAAPALLLTNARVKLPPPPPLPRFPMGPGVERAFSRVSDSITPTAWSVAPETIPPVQPHTAPQSSRRALPLLAGGVALGAAAAIALSLWSPARPQQPEASRWVETPAALAAPATGARVHYLPTTIIHAGAAPMAEDRGTAPPAAVAFDRRRATAMVSAATRRAFACGLRGTDTSVEVTFEESGRAVLVNVKGDHPLSPAAETCANEELFTLQVPSFLGGTPVVRVHLDGQTGDVRR